MINLISIFFQFVIFFSWGIFAYFMYEYILRMKELFRYKRFEAILYAHINLQIHFTFMVIYLIDDIREGRLWKVNMK